MRTIITGGSNVHGVAAVAFIGIAAGQGCRLSSNRNIFREVGNVQACKSIWALT